MGSAALQLTQAVVVWHRPARFTGLKLFFIPGKQKKDPREGELAGEGFHRNPRQTT